MTDQLVQALIPKLCKELVPKIIDALKSDLDKKPKAKKVKPSSARKEFYWPAYNASNKGEFIVGCPFNGGSAQKCELIKMGIKHRDLKGDGLWQYGDDCKECKCHYFVKLVVNEAMMAEDNDLKFFENESKGVMLHHEFRYGSGIGGPETKIWLAHQTNKYSKSKMVNHLREYHKLSDDQIKVKFPALGIQRASKAVKLDDEVTVMETEE